MLCGQNSLFKIHPYCFCLKRWIHNANGNQRRQGQPRLKISAKPRKRSAYHAYCQQFLTTNGMDLMLLYKWQLQVRHLVGRVEMIQHTNDLSSMQLFPTNRVITVITVKSIQWTHICSQTLSLNRYRLLIEYLRHLQHRA